MAVVAEALSCVLRVLFGLFLIGYSHPLSGFPLHYNPGVSYRYTYNTVTSLNDPGLVGKVSEAKRDVGIRISTTVDITPVWKSENTLIVKLSILNPTLHSVARQDLSRELFALPRLPVYFEWEAGRIGQVYVGDDDTTLAINIKKGIISLFQLRIEDGTHSEVDVSGECQVHYKVAEKGAVVTKTKLNCDTLDPIGRYRQVNPLLGIDISSFSSIVYNIENDIIKTVTASEKLLASLSLRESLSAEVNVSQSLTFVETNPSQTLEARNIELLLRKLGKDKNHKLYGMPLGTTFESRQCNSIACKSAVDLVTDYAQNLHTQKIGTLEASVAFRELVKAFRETPKDSIVKILKDKRNEIVTDRYYQCSSDKCHSAGIDGLSQV